jgi:hypothetical protein
LSTGSDDRSVDGSWPLLPPTSPAFHFRPLHRTGAPSWHLPCKYSPSIPCTGQARLHGTFQAIYTPLPSLIPDRRAYMAPSMQCILDLLIAASWFLVFIYLPFRPLSLIPSSDRIYSKNQHIKPIFIIPASAIQLATHCLLEVYTPNMPFLLESQYQRRPLSVVSHGNRRHKARSVPRVGSELEPTFFLRLER